MLELAIVLSVLVLASAGLFLALRRPARGGGGVCGSCRSCPGKSHTRRSSSG